ncbi:PD-(D/E)XK nuclease-like domain-containing protein [Micromonospora taraxaci]|uniref:PD-(D/E)XK nuclease-like domain-containing protein n=1 Tax=Micromonospora taraxaci TaxID=1316803 RepID=UPI003C2E05B9
MTTAELIVTEPGLYPDMSEAVYHGDPVPAGSLSSTGAKKLITPGGPAKYDYERRNPPPSKDEFDLGKAFHTAALGAGAGIAVCDFRDWKTNAAKDAKKAAYEAGLVPLLTHQAAAVEAMVDALQAHPLAAALLTGGKAEQSAFWVDERTGVWRRIRCDYLRANEVIDLKTCDSAAAEAAGRASANYGYHQQADYYLDGVRALDLCPDPAFVFIYVEKTPPHLVHVVQLDGPALAKGAELNARALDIYAECTRTGVWPGYGNDITTVSLPPWATRTEEF